MNNSILWNFDDELSTFDCCPVQVPSFMSEVSPYDVAAIIQGGCASGAYMPAVIYADAMATMAEHGDDVLEFIETHARELPAPNPGASWSGMAVFYLSYAVDLWAQSIEDDLTEYLENLPRFAAGWNMPGYMPDCEPEQFPDFDDAKAYIMETLERFADESETEEQAEELSALAQDVNLESDEFTTPPCAGLVFWVSEM